MGLGLDFAVGRRWKHLRFDINLGFKITTSGSTLGDIQADDELRFAAAVGVPLFDDVLMPYLELVGATVIAPNAAEASVVAMASPPGSRPSQLLAAR